MSDENLQIFIDEAYDLLNDAEQALLNLDDLDEQSPDAIKESVNGLFRTFHTIKGAAGLFGLTDIVGFTHVVESVLVKVRDDELAISEDLVSIFLDSKDHLTNLIALAAGQLDPDNATLSEKGNALFDQLGDLMGASSEAIISSHNDRAGSFEWADEDEDGVKSDNWHISIRFSATAFTAGIDPLAHIEFLSTIGEIRKVITLPESIPDWETFDPETCYLGFEISLHAPNSNKFQIESAFEFAQNECNLFILPPHSHIDQYIDLINSLPEQDMLIGDILVACGALTHNEKDELLALQDKLKDEDEKPNDFPQNPPLLGELAVENKSADQKVVDSALEKQKRAKAASNTNQQSIRVNAKKLEDLVDLVGELVIGAANSELVSKQSGNTQLIESTENLMRMIEAVRDSALGLRMVPIGETFNRFKRVVREVAKDTGKQIELIINGADTELDKTLVEKIGDPLMHLVRNAVDHGIEATDRRVALGKPEKGRVTLDAFHDSGNVVIQVKDDGAGLSKERILHKALDKGLINSDDVLSDQEIFALIFAAGFSTAESVSNISGRGVGMDVVRKNIESLRGFIEMDSTEGVGTTMSIRLPLTLAIINGFLVRFDKGLYIFPLDMIEECIELTDDLKNDNEAQYINLRGEVLPYVHLSEALGMHNENQDPPPLLH